MRIRNNIFPFLILVFGGLLLAKTITYGEDFWVNFSTNITGEATLYNVPEVRPGDIYGFYKINTRASRGTLIVFDSSATANNSYGVIPLSSGIPAGKVLEGYTDQGLYMVRLSTRLTYSKSRF